MRLLAYLVFLLFIISIPGQIRAQSLTVSNEQIAHDNSNHGTIFDVSSKNNITINTVKIKTQSAGVFSIYTRNGSYVGHDNSSDGWTLLDTANTSAEESGKVIFHINQTIPANSVIGFYIASRDSTSLYYKTSNIPIGDVILSDENISIHNGAGMLNSNNTIHFTGVTHWPRTFLGSMTYQLGLHATPSIPTMSTWATLLLCSLILGCALIMLRRKFAPSRS